MESFWRCLKAPRRHAGGPGANGGVRLLPLLSGRRPQHHTRPDGGRPNGPTRTSSVPSSTGWGSLWREIDASFTTYEWRPGRGCTRSWTWVTSWFLSGPAERLKSRWSWTASFGVFRPPPWSEHGATGLPLSRRPLPWLRYRGSRMRRKEGPALILGQSRPLDDRCRTISVSHPIIVPTHMTHTHPQFLALAPIHRGISGLVRSRSRSRRAHGESFRRWDRSAGVPTDGGGTGGASRCPISLLSRPGG